MARRSEARSRAHRRAARRRCSELDLEKLRELFEQRLQRAEGAPRRRQPLDRHRRHVAVRHAAARTRPACASAAGGGRSAMAVADERRFKEYRRDVVLDVRQIDVALRSLRRLGREGAHDELDLDETIDETASNAGELEIVFRPPRRNRVKVLLLMDVGGSMDPHAELCRRLFTAASRTGRFAKFRSYYFHNCVYNSVYEDAQFRKGRAGRRPAREQRSRREARRRRRRADAPGRAARSGRLDVPATRRRARPASSGCAGSRITSAAPRGSTRSPSGSGPARRSR